jgi:hypothetical protein
MTFVHQIIASSSRGQPKLPPALPSHLFYKIKLGLLPINKMLMEEMMVILENQDFREVALCNRIGCKQIYDRKASDDQRPSACMISKLTPLCANKNNELSDNGTSC